MSTQTEREIIQTALEHPGLLSSLEARFVKRISSLPANVQLTASQSQWLYDIGRKKLDLTVGSPKTRTIVDIKTRAYT